MERVERCAEAEAGSGGGMGGDDNHTAVLVHCHAQWPRL